METPIPVRSRRLQGNGLGCGGERNAKPMSTHGSERALHGAEAVQQLLESAVNRNAAIPSTKHLIDQRVGRGGRRPDVGVAPESMW
jgi:hypothetical protein